MRPWMCVPVFGHTLAMSTNWSYENIMLFGGDSWNTILNLYSIVWLRFFLLASILLFFLLLKRKIKHCIHEICYVIFSYWLGIYSSVFVNNRTFFFALFCRNTYCGKYQYLFLKKRRETKRFTWIENADRMFTMC